MSIHDTPYAVSNLVNIYSLGFSKNKIKKSRVGALTLLAKMRGSTFRVLKLAMGQRKRDKCVKRAMDRVLEARCETLGRKLTKR